MSTTDKIKNIFKECVDSIVLYCLTRPIDYRHDSDSEKFIGSVANLLETYTDRFMVIFEDNKEKFMSCGMDEDEEYDFMSLFINSITIISAMHRCNRNKIESIIMKSLVDIKKV